MLLFASMFNEARTMPCNFWHTDSPSSIAATSTAGAWANESALPRQDAALCKIAKDNVRSLVILTIMGMAPTMMVLRLSPRQIWATTCQEKRAGELCHKSEIILKLVLIETKNISHQDSHMARLTNNPSRQSLPPDLCHVQDRPSRGWLRLSRG